MNNLHGFIETSSYIDFVNFHISKKFSLSDYVDISKSTFFELAKDIDQVSLVSLRGFIKLTNHYLKITNLDNPIEVEMMVNNLITYSVHLIRITRKKNIGRQCVHLFSMFARPNVNDASSGRKGLYVNHQLNEVLLRGKDDLNDIEGYTYYMRKKVKNGETGQ